MSRTNHFFKRKERSTHWLQVMSTTVRSRVKPILWKKFLSNVFFQMGQWVKNPLTMQEIQDQSLSQEDPLEEEMATHSRTLPEKSHGQRSLAGYCPWGCKESNTTEHTHVTYMHFSFGQCYFCDFFSEVLYLKTCVLLWNFMPLHMFPRLTKAFLKFIWETTAHVSG